jgi:hypothetical protein
MTQRKTREVGRDAKNGKFIQVSVAKARKSTAIVQTIRTKLTKAR